MSDSVLKFLARASVPHKFRDTTMNPRALIINSEDSAYRDAVVLGQGLPLEKNGQPIKYFWKESLRIGAFNDAKGIKHTVDEKRIDNLIGNFKKAKAKGFLPCCPADHVKSGSTNFGFIVDARKNADGNLELLHQIIGEDGIKAVSRNKSSICTVQDVTDEDGEHFDELLDHNAIVPDPQLTSLSDFQPAIAASRGFAVSAAVLSPIAAPTKEPEMDLKLLRTALGATDDTPDADVLTKAIESINGAKTALELSRTQATDIDALRARAENAEARVLTLSKTPDYAILQEKADLLAMKIDLCLEKGKCSKPQADILVAALKDGDKPSILMLSRIGPVGTPIDVALKVLELNSAFVGEGTVGQTNPDPNQPPDAAVKPITPERRAELLNMTGAGRAILADKK